MDSNEFVLLIGKKLGLAEASLRVGTEVAWSLSPTAMHQILSQLDVAISSMEFVRSGWSGFVTDEVRASLGIKPGDEMSLTAFFETLRTAPPRPVEADQGEAHAVLRAAKDAGAKRVKIEIYF